MTVVRKFTPDVRLKQVLNEPGGMTVSSALGRASDNMDSIRDACLTAVDAKIDTLMAFARSQDSDRHAKLYRTANEIFGESGAFGLAELSLAAHSLCSLLAAAEQTRVPDQAIVVHIDAMRALRRPEVAGDKTARGAVLAGLRGLTAKLAAQGG